MRCALLVPAWTPEEIFSSATAGSQINYWQPLGTLYVAASMMKAGHDVRFLNGAFMRHEEILLKLRDFGPRAVGLYSTAFGWKKARYAARAVKQMDAGIFVFAGGPYPIAAKEQCLEEEADIDAVVTGEGELTVVEMLRRLEEGGGLAGVPGLVHREKGGIIRNSPRPLIEDLDSIPFPARELLGEMGRYLPPPATYRRKPVAVMITSRGCDRRCLYCFQIDRLRESGIRYRSVENVMEEIALCLRQGYREIKFLDDTFAADYDRAMRIVREIKARKLDFTWFASACVNQVDKPLLMAFREAGCWAVLFGAESGVQKNLNAIRKGITLEQTRRAVRAAREAGLYVLTPFLFGIPGETFEEGLKTIEFACELNPDVANFHAITPFPGTELYEHMERYGTVSEDLSDFTYQGIAFVPYSMSREDIARLRRIAFRRFYSRPSFLIRRLFSIRGMNDIRAAISGLRSLLSIRFKKGVFNRGGLKGEDAASLDAPSPPAHGRKEGSPHRSSGGDATTPWRG